MANNNELFSSLISDIKTYSGKDPLLPWLRGIRKMKESLSPQLLKEKLPRFLQKCSQTFVSDRRYRNDLRYLRVWLQLMDFVDDPRAILKTMDENRIGIKRSLYYQAYALYYEKVKKFEEAEKMYHLGVQNLAEPVDELQKSYEQFLHRMQRHKKKKIQRQEGRTAKRPLNDSTTVENNENICRVEGSPTEIWHKEALPETLPDDKIVATKKILNESSQRVKPLMESKEFIGKIGPGSISKQRVATEKELDELRMFGSDDTVVVKFIDTAIVGRSEVEDACHHGLVEPTINMKEAMNAINSMFREPIQTAPVGRRSHRSRQKEDHSFKNGFEVFIDENLDNGLASSDLKEEKGSSVLQHSRTETCQSQHQSQQEPFQIYVDDEESSETGERNEEVDNFEHSEVQNVIEGSITSTSRQNAFVFPSPKDLASEGSDDQDVESSPQAKFREDTVVCRFVGSTISDEPVVENVCHHGLVEPTINLKEAMDDINNMFGKPIDFVRTRRSKKQEKAPERKRDFGGFSILPDDDLENIQVQPRPNLSGTSRECDLFEPTMFTKEAIDDINKMFGMPLDF